MKKDNIILVGMPASGKSTMGVILAKILGYSFIDADIVIQEKEGRKLSEIIEQDGVEGFIAIENRINSEIEAQKTVIATGGSVVYGKEAMDHYKNIGRIVYLKVSMDELTKRLSDVRQRGVVMREGQSLVALYNERSALYEKYADVTVDEKNLSLEEVLAEIIAELSRQKSISQEAQAALPL
ncbi:shikimate kinase [Butyrivibrio sp. FCS014]|uniref:shikimate kinase n=1 Tax=Butyrivibrio sp. FCS014 TaxID=1408304 RepID=UPI000464EF0B|nr:shikimate kinase [Butyrivibrio sp. FCS014]